MLLCPVVIDAFRMQISDWLEQYLTFILNSCSPKQQAQYSTDMVDQPPVKNNMIVCLVHGCVAQLHSILFFVVTDCIGETVCSMV
jgi:hypothetical protein